MDSGSSLKKGAGEISDQFSVSVTYESWKSSYVWRDELNLWPCLASRFHKKGFTVLSYHRKKFLIKTKQNKTPITAVEVKEWNYDSCSSYFLALCGALHCQQFSVL